MDLKWRDEADAELGRVMELYGSSELMADIYEAMVDRYAAFAADPENKAEILMLPTPQEQVKLNKQQEEKV